MAEAGSPKAKAEAAPAKGKKEPKEPVVTNPRSKLLLANRIQSAVPTAERGVVYVSRAPGTLWRDEGVLERFKASRVSTGVVGRFEECFQVCTRAVWGAL